MRVLYEYVNVFLIRHSKHTHDWKTYSENLKRS